MNKMRPHILGIDDGPFEKFQHDEVTIVGVTMEGHDLIESVAMTSFPVDGSGVTDFLLGWIGSLRVAPSLQAVMFGGITIAGLGIVDIAKLSEGVGRPVVIVNRKDPSQSRLAHAFEAAGMHDRLAILAATPVAHRLHEHCWVAAAGIDSPGADELVVATVHKASIPEPLRVAHLIATATTEGASRGRA